MNYQERIEQVGQGKKPTKVVQTALDEYEAVLDAIAQGKQELKDADEDEAEGIQNDLAELEETAELMLIRLNKAIDKWADGIKRIDNMNKKKNQSSTPNATSPITASTSQPTSGSSSASTQPSQSNVQTLDSKKEESGYGWLIFGGLALVLSLGAINVMKNK